MHRIKNFQITYEGITKSFFCLQSYENIPDILCTDRYRRFIVKTVVFNLMPFFCPPPKVIFAVYILFNVMDA